MAWHILVWIGWIRDRLFESWLNVFGSDWWCTDQVIDGLLLYSHAEEEAGMLVW